MLKTETKRVRYARDAKRVGGGASPTVETYSEDHFRVALRKAMAFAAE